MHPLCLAETPGTDQNTKFKLICTLDRYHEGLHYDSAFLRGWRRTDDEHQQRLAWEQEGLTCQS